jgi:hypothetical protein
MCAIRRSASLLFGLWVAVGLVPAQQNGRFALLKSQAFTLFDRGQYDQVAGKLEEVWEQDQSDPKVAAYLAMGYLYGEHDPLKAKPLMKAAIDLGGQAMFLVQHSHEKTGVVGGIVSGGVMNNYCNGRIGISPGTIGFIADSGEHSVSFAGSDVKELHILGGASGRIQIKSVAKTYVFRVKSEKRDEAALLEEFATENLTKPKRP